MTLIRNNIAASEIKRRTGEAEYIYRPGSPPPIGRTWSITTAPMISPYIWTPFRLPTTASILITGDFNSQSQSWGYDTLDTRGEEIEK